jgi:hypothetical protein
MFGRWSIPGLAHFIAIDGPVSHSYLPMCCYSILSRIETAPVQRGVRLS